MSTKVIASLSEDGWVDDPNKMLDYLVSYYILTDAEQSYVFKGELISLPKTYYEHINDPANLAMAMRSDFNRLLENYFSQTEVVCYAKEDETNTGLFYIFLSASVMDDLGVRYDLNRILKLNESRANNVITYNNYADAYSDFLSL